MKSMTCALAALAFVASPSLAQDAPATTSAAPIVSADASGNAVLRTGTPVHFKMMEEVTTKNKAARVGQRFNLEVAAPIEVNGTAIIPEGTPAVGEITEVRNKGMWGKSGHLTAQLLFLRVNGRQIRLTGTFDDKGVTGTAGVVGAIAFVPIAGFFMTGTSATFPKGGAVNGFIDEDVPLAMAAAAPAPMQVQQAPAAMPVPAQPAPAGN